MDASTQSKAILSERKARHIDICCNEDLQVEGDSTYFEHVSFLHHSLPELHAANISTECSFLQYRLRAPLLISCMTGGSAEGFVLNKILAKCAQTEGIAVGTGSLRILLHKPEVIEHFRFKEDAADVPVLGNIAAVQLQELFADSAALLRKFFTILSDLEMDAIVLHLNPGQELFQSHGDRDFRHILHNIQRFCVESPLPVIVKETGAGIAPHEADLLFRAGVRYVDIAGAGGTNWMTVEAIREQGESATGKAAAGGFADWGIPTALALHAARSFCSRTPLHGGFIASGGLRSPSDFAKALAMGARLAATALPLIQRAKNGGLELCRQYIQNIVSELKKCMFLSAAQNIAEFQNGELLYTSEFLHYSHMLQARSERENYKFSTKLPQAAHATTQADSLKTATIFSNVFADRKFWKQGIVERRQILRQLGTGESLELEATDHSPAMLNIADRLVESAVGIMPVPLGIVRSLLLDGRRYNVPIATEEPSVLAAANFAAGIVAKHGGFTSNSEGSNMRSCVYIRIKNETALEYDTADFVERSVQKILSRKGEIGSILQKTLRKMTERGGGFRDLSCVWLAETRTLRVDILIDVCDAMGANLLNTVAEEIAPYLEQLTQGKKILAILTNAATERLATAEFGIPVHRLKRGSYEGRELAERIVLLSDIAKEDRDRAVTHNKGIMNGISGLALATANDVRAIEAAAHAWAARSGRYSSLSSYYIANDALCARIALPLAFATVGGAVSYNPAAQLCLEILGKPGAQELSRIAAALGLAQNFAAILALASEGIQKGHMALHERRTRISW